MTEFHTATMTNSEFYRANAPKQSVARASVSELRQRSKSRKSSISVREEKSIVPSMNVTSKSFNPIERISFSAARDPS
jgi:hypothetical protein